MAKGAASEATLGGLHNKVAKVMVDALDVFDKAQEQYLESDDAELMAPVLNPALLSVMTKFLSDNSITCAPEESKGLTDLEEKLKKRRKRVGNVVHLREEA